MASGESPRTAPVRALRAGIATGIGVVDWGRGSTEMMMLNALRVLREAGWLR